MTAESKPRKTNLTDYEKAVISVASEMYSAEIINRKDTEYFPSEVIQECLVEAFELVDSALEVTREE